MKCPICGGLSHPRYKKHGHTIYVCNSCNHQYIEFSESAGNTQKIYSDDYFYEGGAGYQDYTKQADLLIAHGERYGDILKKYNELGTVLDVGAAAGFLLQGLINNGWQGKGIEPNNTMATYARETFELDIITGTFEEYRFDEKFDLITMVQVIGHFYDIRKAIENAQKALRKDGMLLIETWNRASLPARILGLNWHEYSPPSVVNWFSISGLNTLVGQFGFEEVARGHPTKRIYGSHVKSLMRYKGENIASGKILSYLLNVIPDNVLIPYPSFDLVWILYRFR